MASEEPAIANRPRRLPWAAGLGAAAVLLFWCYLLESRTTSVNADSAGQVLQGWDMLHGNPLLRGWFLGDVSFYTFEIPVDGLVATVSGLQADVVHVTGALFYTLLVLTAALLARGRARGPAGVVRALLAAGVLLVPSLYPGAHVLLLSADHTGVGVPVMLTLLFVDRARERWYLPAVACLLLTWAQLDDPVATYTCAAPLAIVCAIRAAAASLTWLGSRRSARAAALPWSDAVLAVAAAFSYELTQVVQSAISDAGGFYQYPVATGLAAWAAIPRQLQWTWQNVLYLFGANYFKRPTALQAAIGDLHLAGLAVALCGLVIGLWGLFFRLGPAFGPGPSGRADRVTQALTVGTVAMLAAGAFGTHMAPVAGAHEIAIALPLGAVLGGRLVGPWLTARRGAAHGRLRAGTITRLAVASALTVAGAGYVSALGYSAAQPGTQATTQDLADWLVSHQLTAGIAGYWEANVTTLASHGTVRLAPLNRGGRYAYPWESKASWYDPAVSQANFVVTVSGPPVDDVYAQPAVILARYGAPASTYLFGRYTVMVYDYNLLSRVRPPVAGRR